MFEDEMLLPNLEFNPEFEGKHEANNLLSLSDDVQDRDAGDSLLSLAQQANWLHSRSLWVPRS